MVIACRKLTILIFHQLLVMFAVEADQLELMRALMADCTSVFLNLCSSSPNLSPHSDLIQAFYNMHLKLMKKDANMVALAVNSNLTEVFKCGELKAILLSIEPEKCFWFCLP